MFYKLNTQRQLDSLKISDLFTNDKGYSLSATNRKLILNFVNYCFSEDINEHRALKYLSTLKIVTKSISVGFDKASEEDIRAYVGGIERSSLSGWTKHDYKVLLKKFYKLSNGEEEHPATKISG